MKVINLLLKILRWIFVVFFLILSGVFIVRFANGGMIASLMLGLIFFFIAGIILLPKKKKDK